MPVRHNWNVSPERARMLQEELRALVETADRLGPVGRIAGVDVAYTRPGVARAAVAVLDAETLVTVEVAVVERRLAFPYLPGLFSFREVPPAVAAFRRLARPPDLVLCDGHGLAHPRRFGLACHLGLVLDVPAIGVAKRLLVGSHALLGAGRGAHVPLIDHDEVVGAAVRTRAGVRPVYVSVGHRVSLDTAVAWALSCATRFRLPEPSRAAHAAATRV